MIPVFMISFPVTVSTTTKSDIEKGSNFEKVGFEKAIELTGKLTHWSGTNLQDIEYGSITDPLIIFGLS